MKRHVGEHRHLREQHREADAAGRDQPAIAEQVRDRAAAGAAPCAVRLAGSRGSHSVSTAATAPVRIASATNAAGQLTSAATRPDTARPVKPPRIVPVM